MFPRSSAPSWLRSATLPLALAVTAFAAPAAAHAADNLGTGGVTAPGSALTVGVSGAAGQAGKLGARFSAVGTPLFWGSDRSTMNDGTAAVFALNTPSGLYSAQDFGMDNAPFTQTSAPVLTGTGTAGDPFVVTSQFDATASIHLTQTVTHVSGTTKFKATWSILNASGSPIAMQAFEGADLYVNGNDNGTGTISGLAGSRTIGGVASDGTVAQLVEQGGSQWTHYFSGMTQQFYNSTGDSTFGSLADTIDPTNQDNGLGTEWDFVLGGGATKTVSIEWNFTHPGLPQAPRVTGGVPAANANTQATTASPAFTYAVGDSSNSVAFECALDGGTFIACASPESLTGLADGSHTFSVRALNSAGDPGPQTDRTWTVDTTPPVAPTLTGAPTGTVAVDHASIALSGENGATFRCSVDGLPYGTCSSPLVLTGLADGNHVVNVKQVDAANNTGTLVGTASWTVDTSVPAVPSTDSEPVDTLLKDATLAFTTPAGLTAECSLDSAAYQACVSPLNVTGLAVGRHTLKLRMVNAAGTAGAARTTTWDVLAPPVVTPPATPVVTPPVNEDKQVEAPAAETPVVTPPAAKPTCVSRRSVTVNWSLPKGTRLKSQQVLVDGKALKAITAKTLKANVDLSGRGVGTADVVIRARTTSGVLLTNHRRYVTCTGARSAGTLKTIVLRAAR